MDIFQAYQPEVMALHNLSTFYMNAWFNVMLPCSRVNLRPLTGDSMYRSETKVFHTLENVGGSLSDRQVNLEKKNTSKDPTVHLVSCI